MNEELNLFRLFVSVDLKHKEDSIRLDYNKHGNYGANDDDGFKWLRSSWMQGYLGLGGYEYRQYYGEDQLENGVLANYYISSKETVFAVKGYDYVLVKEPYTDSTRVDLVAGYQIKQQEDFDQDRMIVHIGTNTFTFSTRDLAKQLLAQTDKIKPYQDQGTPQGLDKRYELPQQMLRITQRKGNMEVTAQIMELSFDYSQKQGVKISSVRAYYFIKVK